MSRPTPAIPVRPVFGPAEVDTGPPLVDAEAEAFPLAEVLTLPELDELAFGAVEGLGVDAGVPPPATVPVPATEPGEPARG